jgi:hypothetical protein
MPILWSRGTGARFPVARETDATGARPRADDDPVSSRARRAGARPDLPADSLLELQHDCEMSTTLIRAAEIAVDLPAEQAMELFTPEGERSWAGGWDPQYPQADRREGPGAVFTTGHGGHQTTWIMVDHGPASVRYARVTHGMTAGMVAVEVVGSGEHSTRVRVTYDLTALTTTGEAWLDAFDAGYDTEIGGWATEISRRGG